MRLHFWSRSGQHCDLQKSVRARRGCIPRNEENQIIRNAESDLNQAWYLHCWLWRNWHVVTCQKTVWYNPDEKVEFGKKSSNDWKIHNIACLVVYFIEYGKEYNRSFYVVSPWIRQDLILTCIFQFKIEDSAAGWLKNVQMVKLGENLQNSNINRMTLKSSSSEHFCLEQIPA